MSTEEQPTQDERTMAVLAQVLQIVGWWIAPLIILVVRRQSRFVSFHALQAILLQVAHTVLMGTVMIGLFATVIVSVATAVPEAGKPPLAFFFLFLIVWLVMMVASLTTWVLAIVYGIKAGRGEWAAYPLLGRLARRILKIGPVDPAHS